MQEAHSREGPLIPAVLQPNSNSQLAPSYKSWRTLNKSGFSHFCPSHEDKGMKHLLDQLWLNTVWGYHHTTGRWSLGCSNLVVLKTKHPKNSCLLWKLCLILSQLHRTYLTVNGDETSSGGGEAADKICTINQHSGPSDASAVTQACFVGRSWAEVLLAQHERLSTTASSAFLFLMQGFNF